MVAVKISTSWNFGGWLEYKNNQNKGRKTNKAEHPLRIGIDKSHYSQSASPDKKQKVGYD